MRLTSGAGSNLKDLLQVGDWVTGVAAGNPELCAATPEQSTKIIRFNKDATIHCEADHFCWRCGGIENALKLWVTIDLVKEVIQRIKQLVR